MKTLIKSPVLHFILLGALAFLVYSQLKPTQQETIRITSQTIEALVQYRQSISQSPVSPEERREIIQGHIEDEILLREAFRRDFHKNDFRVRKRILNLMRSSLSDNVPEPSAAQLRKYYQEHQKRFATPPSRSIDQVFFSFTQARQPRAPQAFLQRLTATPDFSQLGEFSNSFGPILNKASFRSLAGMFGKSFAQVVFDLPLNQWRGPIESFHGTHYVRVRASHEAEVPPFEQMQSYLRSDYLLFKARQSQERKIAELRKNYQVVVEGQ